MFAAAPQLRPIYMGVTEPTWGKALSRPFEALQWRLEAWIAEALAIMEPRLEEEELPA